MGLIAAFDKAPRPFLLKCSGGQDRTSLAAALYLIHRGGWEAMTEARAQYARFPYLHFPKTHQRWLKAFLDFAAEDADGAPTSSNGIETAYTPEALKDWLDQRGMGQSYAAIFSVPTRSPHSVVSNFVLPSGLRIASAATATLPASANARRGEAGLCNPGALNVACPAVFLLWREYFSKPAQKALLDAVLTALESAPFRIAP